MAKSGSGRKSPPPPPKKKASGKKAAAAEQPVVAKAPVKMAVAVKKTAAPVVAKKRPAAARKAAAPVLAVTKPAPRRAAKPGRVPVARKVAAAKVKQVFTVSHLQEADFKADGLRAYALYRDLGIAAATSGRCQAHVIRMVPPCTDAVRQRHLHETELQLVYVLKGWMKNEFEGHGEQMMSAGSCWLQPTGIRHTVLDYSPDCELLEIIVPADFKTRDVESVRNSVCDA